MVALRERLTAHLNQNWREDLEPVWRGFFEGVEPDLGELPEWGLLRQSAGSYVNASHPRF